MGWGCRQEWGAKQDALPTSQVDEAAGMVVEEAPQEQSGESSSSPSVRRVGTVDDLCCLDEELESFTAVPEWCAAPIP